MKLVVGLGNPGNEYANTRHNVGMRVVETMAPSFAEKKKFNALVARQGEVLFALPLTFMNRSGEAVRRLMDFYKVTPQDVLLVYDDKDIRFGTIRLRSEGSSAGHNGVQSVIDHIGEEFARVRVGIGNDDMVRYVDQADFVLARFNRHEEKMLPEIIQAAARGVQELLQNNLDKTAHRDITVSV